MAAMNDRTSSFVDSRDFARIARAIRYIDANFRAQPRLAAIAAAAHLSEFHFNRLFRRWAGVTPAAVSGLRHRARRARCAAQHPLGARGGLRRRASRAPGGCTT